MYVYCIVMIIGTARVLANVTGPARNTISRIYLMKSIEHPVEFYSGYKRLLN